MIRQAVLAALALSLPLRGAAGTPTPIGLDEALALAARASPDLALARADADAAAADRAAALAGVLPRLDLSSSAGHQFSGPRGPQPFVLSGVSIPVPGTPASDEETYALSLQLSQPLLDWRTFLDVARADSSRRAAERQYDEAALSVAFDVTQRFYESVRADRVLAVLERTATRSQELVERADALFAAGRAPKSDTLQARVNLANDRIALEGQRIRVARARTSLAQALGRADGADLVAVAPAALDRPLPPAPEPPPLEELVARARARRPAVAAQSELVRAADQAVSSARGGLLPSLAAQGAYSRQGPVAAGREGVFGDPTRAYGASAQLVLTWNVFEGRRTLAQVRRAEASARRARASQERTDVLVAKEIADARAAVVALVREVAIAAESLSTAEQGLALARGRLEAGLASQLEVRDASLKLGQAELSLVQARIDHAVAQADLSRAAGGAS